MSTDIMKEIFGNSLRRTGEKETPKDRAAHDFQFFCEYYLADYFTSPWSEAFHKWLIHKYEDIIFNHKDEQNKVCVSSPRGHAKSTLSSFAFVLWCALYGYKKFIVIISATAIVAKQFILNIRDAIEFNPLIKRDFGSLKNDSLWNSQELLLRTGAYIICKGANAQLRGLQFGGTRPDLALLDDMESQEEVDSPTQVDSLEHWLTADVIPMLSVDGDAIFIGTVLSYNSVLWRLLTEARFASWERKRFQAVIEFSPSNLWAEWESIMTDLSRGDNAYREAKDFYNKHKKEMLEGAKVLWPDQRKDQYLYLMEKRLESEESFASEYQNDPMTENLRVFKTEWLENNYYEKTPDIKEVNIALDPAVSTSRTADYSVILVLGRGTDNYFYVLECDAQKRSGDKLIDDAKKIIATYYRYRPKIICETNQFQAFFSTTLQKDLVDSGIYLEWIDVMHMGKDKKKTRIESLAPHIRQGHIKFKKDQSLLLYQLRMYPRTHDDCPDALHMAISPMLESSIAKFSFGSFGGNTTHNENGSRMTIKQLGEQLKKWGGETYE